MVKHAGSCRYNPRKLESAAVMVQGGRPANLNKGGLKMSNKVYEIITEQILDKLEKGVVPWHQPWIGGGYPIKEVSD